MKNQFIATGRSCPACGVAARDDKGEKNGFALLECRGCGSLYVSRVPGSNEGQNYDEYYAPEHFGVPEFVSRRLDEIIAGFDAHRGQNRLLDVGCGGGDLMQAARRAGWDAEGVEVSTPAATHVRSLGFKVHRGTLDEARYPDVHFDVVTSSEVLEHVPDPRAVVEEVYRVLRAGGLFWATTPHGSGASARLLKLDWSIVSPPEHLQLFSVKGVKTLLKSVGFRDVRVVTHGVNPYELLHVLRSRGRATNGVKEDAANTFNRNETAYALNEAMMQSNVRRSLKGIANGLLATVRLGDSLKIHAVK